MIQHGEHEQEARGIDEVTKTYDALLALYDKGTARPHVMVCVGNWSLDLNADKSDYHGWSAQIEHAMQSVCAKHGFPFVTVASVAADPLCHGAGQHPGVQWHPNDRVDTRSTQTSSSRLCVDSPLCPVLYYEA